MRQCAARGADRGLNVLAGGVDVAVEIELQRDLAQPLRACRTHALKGGYLPKLALERRGYEPRHRIRVRAGKLRRDLDDGEINLRERRIGRNE